MRQTPSASPIGDPLLQVRRPRACREASAEAFVLEAGSRSIAHAGGGLDQEPMRLPGAGDGHAEVECLFPRVGRSGVDPHRRVRLPAPARWGEAGVGSARRGGGAVVSLAVARWRVLLALGRRRTWRAGWA